MNLERFTPHLNKVFAAGGGDTEPVPLELVEAKLLRAPPADDESVINTGGRPDPFVVLFRGAEDNQLQQGMYQFACEGFEPCTLFIVPVGRDERGVYYESVFN